MPLAKPLFNPLKDITLATACQIIPWYSIYTSLLILLILQVITYKEYLPGTLGPQAMTEYNLNLGSPNYLDTVMPQVANEFATAAFRFGHNEVKNIHL